MISIGGIIGAGLFVGTSATISAAGPGVLLSYLGAGLVVWLVMQLLGRLAIGARGRDSFISHVEKILGPRAAFITGWSYAFLWAVTAGAQAVAGGLVVGELTGWPPMVGALGFIVIAWGINRLSLRHYGQTETALSVLKLLFLGVFILTGVLWVVFSQHPLHLVMGNLVGQGGFFPLGGWAVLGAVPMIVQSFSGCEISVIAAGDSTRPLRNIARTMRNLPLQILFFYAGSVLVIVSVMSWTHVRPGYSPFLEVMRLLQLPFAAAAAVAVTLIAVLSCLNSSVYVVSRILRELSGLALAPAPLLQETPQGIPIWSLRLTTLMELVIVACAVGSPAKAYPILLGASGGVILFVYFMVALAAWHSGVARRLGLLVSGLLFVLGLLMLCLPSTRFDTCLSLGLIGGLALAALLLVRRPEEREAQR